MNKIIKNKITLKEFGFLRSYIDIASPTFGNAYKSALKAGYSMPYCRVIRRQYPAWRMRWLKRALGDDGLVRMIEATRHLSLGIPMANTATIKRIVRSGERKLIGMSAQEVISALEKLLGKSI